MVSDDKSFILDNGKRFNPTTGREITRGNEGYLYPYTSVTKAMVLDAETKLFLVNEVLARQKRTNSSDYLVKKGTSLKEIDEKFQDQVKKGYIEKIDIKKENIYRKDSYFLSYFPVVNRTKDTSSLRIVFDAKSKDKSGSSLNGAIEKGPNRLNDLFAILLRFRRFHYAFTADISEMFLRIRLTEADKRYHRFWWNENFWQWNRILC